MGPPPDGGLPRDRGGGRSLKKLIEVLGWSLEHRGGLAEDIDKFEAKEGPVETERLIEAWRSWGWPGPLTAENERILRWAVCAEALGTEAADARYEFEIDDGNEEEIARRQMIAIGFVRRKASEAAQQEASRGV